MKEQAQTMTGVYKISFKGPNSDKLKLSISEVNSIGHRKGLETLFS